MTALSEEIKAFEAQRETLEADHMGQWVVFFEEKLRGIFPDMELAAQEAVTKYGRGPYLIRQIGAAPLTLPASVMYSPSYANY